MLSSLHLLLYAEVAHGALHVSDLASGMHPDEVLLPLPGEPDQGSPDDARHFACVAWSSCMQTLACTAAPCIRLHLVAWSQKQQLLAPQHTVSLDSACDPGYTALKWAPCALRLAVLRLSYVGGPAHAWIASAQGHVLASWSTGGPSPAMAVSVLGSFCCSADSGAFAFLQLCIPPPLPSQIGVLHQDGCHLFPMPGASARSLVWAPAVASGHGRGCALICLCHKQPFSAYLIDCSGAAPVVLDTHRFDKPILHVQAGLSHVAPLLDLGDLHLLCMRPGIQLVETARITLPSLLPSGVLRYHGPLLLVWQPPGSYLQWPNWPWHAVRVHHIQWRAACLPPAGLREPGWHLCPAGCTAALEQLRPASAVLPARAHAAALHGCRAHACQACLALVEAVAVSLAVSV